MELITYPNPVQWAEVVKRPVKGQADLTETVCDILRHIQEEGDRALLAYEECFDKVKLITPVVSQEEMDEAENLLSDELKDSIRLAANNIAAFHGAQRFIGEKVSTQPGVTCWQKAVPIEKVGLYIPGGTAPLFSTVLMLATPAKLAGCEEIVLCTPPNKEGKVHPAILVAARIAGVSKIFKAGGVQAIGAMAYGTQSVPKVYKIFGPGNQYVMAAKQQVSLHDVAIDMPAGPSEVCVIADAHADAKLAAADLLSQAEHGVDSQVLLICTDERKMEEIREQVERQQEALPRRDIAAQSLANSRLVLVNDTREAMALSNAYAPEHLILATDDYEQLAELVINAGSVFLGKYACESAGDYASGTNHTLPTHGYATAYSGVNLDSYHRKVTFQHLSREGVESIGKAVVTMAENEQLEAHANAMRLRMFQE